MAAEALVGHFLLVCSVFCLLRFVFALFNTILFIPIDWFQDQSMAKLKICGQSYKNLCQSSKRVTPYYDETTFYSFGIIACLIHYLMCIAVHFSYGNRDLEMVQGISETTIASSRTTQPSRSSRHFTTSESSY